jgi:amino acid transporter
MTTHHLLPAWNGLAGLVLIINSFFTYAGAEVNAVHVDELKNPGSEFPKAMFVAAAIVLAIFILPTLAISWVIPSAKISLTAGVMQAFDGLFKHFGLSWAVPIVAVALAAGALAGMMSWLDGPSEGLLKIGREEGYLPPYFQKLDHEGIQVRILAAQGVVITIIGLLYALIPNVSSAYWVLAAMATQVYLIMYVLMFVAAVRLRRSQPDHPRGYRAPALYAQCVVGVLASVAAFAIAFVPPSQFNHVAGPVVYGLLLLAGVALIGVVPPLLLAWRRKPSWKESPPAQEPSHS